MPNWSRVIKALKRLVDELGPIWPNSTKLSGYSEAGPFHCEDCEFLLRKDGQPVMDDRGKGLCFHRVVMADPEVKKNDKGYGLVHIAKGCCEFVSQPGHEHKEGS